MRKEGKNLKIWGIRADLIGDQVFALPILNYLENNLPNSYKFFSILRKCKQAADLYLNHPLIDKIVVSDFNEGFGETDEFYKKQCVMVFDVRPQHPLEQDWWNFRSVYEETWIMAGLPLSEYRKLPTEQQKPKLYKWFDVKKENKTIFIHCMPGYGFDNHRGISKEYGEYLVMNLTKLGYKVIRVGHPNERAFFRQDTIKGCFNQPNLFYDIRHLSFIEQIQLTLGADIYIGNDSGFSICVGAYNEIPQISLITDWMPNHYTNHNCLTSNNDKNVTLFAKNGCDNIPREKILETIKQF